MIDQGKARGIHERLTRIRSDVLRDYPFFGRLLLRLTFGYAECGTAYTDMQRIVVDPEFAAELSDDELRFLLLHELLHCVLHHCTRGKGLHHLLYNIACDIVVNSLILEMFNLPDFTISGEKVIHLAPDHTEGRAHSAEEFYAMLHKNAPEHLARICAGATIDTHSPWDALNSGLLDDIWQQAICDAAKKAGSWSGIPCNLNRYIAEIQRAPKVNWRQILQDFIRHDRSDYDYSVPDRRFQGALLPSYQEAIYGECVENLWFLIDASGSISDETLSEVFHEVCLALDQIDRLSGYLSYFDAQVSAPIGFESIQDLLANPPVGGGGTSFHHIFDQLPLFFKDELPQSIIILTDGYAEFPAEAASRGVPVLWLICDTEIKPPWGTVAHL